MRENKKFSVVVPVYNGEKYIQRSMMSIINQTCSNWELIIINDGSKDNTAKVVQEIINKHKDKSIIYEEISNSGPSTARNKGMAIAKGDFVCFLDSDDEYDVTLFEKLEKLTCDFDICFFGWKEIFSNNTQKLYTESYSFIDEDNGINVVRKKFNREVWLCNCNEIYRTKFLKENEIHYPEGVYAGEDACFIYTALLNAKKVVSLKENLFLNYIRENSLMRSKVSERDLTEFTALAELIKNITYSKNLNEEEKTEFVQMFLAYKDYVKIAISKKLINEFSFWQYFKFRRKQKNLLKDYKINLKNIKKFLIGRFYKQALIYKFCPILFFIICKKYKRK